VQSECGFGTLGHPLILSILSRARSTNVDPGSSSRRKRSK